MQELWGQILSYARSMWRFRWYSLAAAWAICVVGWAWTVMQPDVYQASARVYVDTTSQLRLLLGDQIVEGDVQAQLNQVRQSMLGRVQLERVARETDLDLNAETPEQMQELVMNLRRTISINSEGATRSTPDNLYTIQYKHPDRQKAIDVVETLLNSFVDDTMEAKRDTSESARVFLNQQIREYEQRLQAAEKRLAEFNRRNYARLPGTQGGYFQRLQSETTALREAQKLLNQAESRRERIRQQLRGESPSVADTTGLPGPLADLDARIRQMESQLDDLLLRFTEQHPDVISTRETLERLLAQRAKQLANTQELGAGGTMVSSNNPVYQSLQIALNEIEVEIATLSADLQSREARVAELQEAIDEIPDVEAEFKRLNRDYDVVQARYQALLGSLERERLSRDAQSTGQIEFRVIDPPVAGSEPVAPDRARLLVMVLLAGIGVAGGVAFLMAQLKPVFSSSGNLQDAVIAPVLGSVQMVWQGRLSRGGNGYAQYLLASSTLLVVFVGIFIVEIIGPGFRNL